jgi:Domain of unknown function (DUF4386)
MSICIDSGFVNREDSAMEGSGKFMSNAIQRSQQAYARLSGLLYLLVMAAFVAPVMMISGFAARGDFAQTAENVLASETLYRAALAMLVFGVAAIVLLGGSLYALLRHVSADLALIALLWRVAEAVLLGVGVIIRFAVLQNYAGAGVDAGSAKSLHQLMSSAIGASSYVSFVCLSTGSLIFFFLLFKSRYLPRALAGFGILASVLLSVASFAYLLFPERVSSLGMMVMTPMFIAEIGAGLWLLIAGANFKYWNSKAAKESHS